jgi:hypothetical protein
LGLSRSGEGPRAADLQPVLRVAILRHEVSAGRRRRVFRQGSRPPGRGRVPDVAGGDNLGRHAGHQRERRGGLRRPGTGLLGAARLPIPDAVASPGRTARFRIRRSASGQAALPAGLAAVTGVPRPPARRTGRAGPRPAGRG